jgi:hypothetical protein
MGHRRDVAPQRQALENRQRVERTQPTRKAPPEEINRRHENEWRALEEQMRRENQILKGRQEERRKVEPAPPASVLVQNFSDYTRYCGKGIILTRFSRTFGEDGCKLYSGGHL